MVPICVQDKPDRLIALSQAAVETGIPIDRLRSWRRTGHLVPSARMRGDAPGGGILLFRMADVLRLLDDPPLRGRPPGKGGGRGCNPFGCPRSRCRR